MSWAVEGARADVALCKRRCREEYDATNGWSPMLQLFGCYNYHQACNELRAAEERLRLLLAKEEAA